MPQLNFYKCPNELNLVPPQWFFANAQNDFLMSKMIFPNAQKKFFTSVKKNFLMPNPSFFYGIRDLPNSIRWEGFEYQSQSPLYQSTYP